MSDHSSEANLHGSVKSYLTGFVLSVILTGIPFWMVMTEAFDKGPTYITIVLLAVVQIFVHLKYFLHLNFSDQGKLDTYSFIFSAVIIVMVVALSVWIIYASNAMMM
ncbi:cytochrome o ubiquinol oxidase subunit IV [Marinomonas primoryensis]|jgi:cytochrome o ubiquinol oxidase operon protein cyoD|uniref:Cytochrome bo(3) ubiquinol oxidase subunit 4 n=1 Tax=Marinomonas primoryensis TaxID=178399 RepID=A0A859CRS4_9GAMM|nr:cytochrome o ubiquinol oxidase subunit IV [Marinomonas primoryensis]QKK78824.1 Cytochrome O ubiquinol oxidase subunit IV [Marinomonas primoryensis]|tara:strand:- start:7181 stop:7501 length:321 start_codon:yes stop_codon:yes gene_type:complete